MNPVDKSKLLHRPASVLAVFAAFLVAGCATPPADHTAEDGPFDPFEETNRETHEFNLAIDRTLFRPASVGFSDALPDGVEDSIGNISENLSMPNVVVNAVLQGDLGSAGAGTARFVMNSTVGILGLFDAATAFGISEADTDFGETLHVWGAQEGAYIELPFFGPSTERDATGMLVDFFFLNPLSFVNANNFRYASPTAQIGEWMSDRGRYTDTIDSILYESADSYAQARLIYLQNRRFELGMDAGTEVDPFELDTEGF